MEFIFPTHDKYLEAWGYLMRIGSGFSCTRETNTIWLDRSDDLEDELDTIARLKEIRDEH